LLFGFGQIEHDESRVDADMTGLKRQALIEPLGWWILRILGGFRC